jgi:hypothetical protein
MGKAERKGGQPETSHITPLLAPLIALQGLLEYFDDQGVIIGGIAASLLGKPRWEFCLLRLRWCRAAKT